MKWIPLALAAAVTCAPCLEWTRLTGTVKNVNLRDATVTILNRDGDLLTIPVDYQVSITAKHDEVVPMRTLRLDQKVTLVRVQAVKPVEDDTAGMAPPELPTRGR